MSKDKIEDAIYTRRYIYNFHYHLIWVTKYRNPTFTSEALVNEMKEILTTVAADNEIDKAGSAGHAMETSVSR